MEQTLNLFSPLVRGWFEDTMGQPTAVQRRTWALIADGEHVLATAPTGSGKTLAAFLWALDQLLTGHWAGGGVRVVYVSPLKALNNDVQRNLLAPLTELTGRASAAGCALPDVRVLTRSGDTPDWERRRMVRSPPEILITTPESLNLLVTARASRAMLTGVRTLILDEIHAVAGTKRGVHLMTAVERLTRVAGELQRVALSATVRPLDGMARLVGGWRLHADGSLERRRVRPVAVDDEKRYRIELVPPPADHGVAGAAWWRALAGEVGRRVEAASSSLVFVSSRRMAERLTRYLNEDRERPLAWAHHGSLSREIRLAVEERLKHGELESIVATSSLELGIDVGALDQVLLVGAPASVAATVQRLGRAGHQVGAESVGCCVATHPRDLLDALALVEAVHERDIEPVTPPRGALDVLAQVLLAMVAGERWKLDELYDFVRTADVYRDLERQHFDLVVEMLAGRYATARVRELSPRVAIDRLNNTIEGRPGTLRQVAQEGGTIPDRGYYALRTEDGARLGELDEEFVWERSAGDVFTFGTQSWRVERISHADVVVSATAAPVTVLPFWRAEALDRSAHLSDRIGRVLEELEAVFVGAGDRDQVLQQLAGTRLGQPAAAALVELLARQREVTGAPLPHRHHLLIERCADATRAQGAEQLIVHTGWGGRCNRPLAMALAGAWRELGSGQPTIDIMADNDCLLLVVPEGVDGEMLLRSVTRERLDRWLHGELERSGVFGARFRESAQRAMLLPRRGRNGRVPLWLSRRRARTLLSSVAELGDFPIVLETWRECLHDAFELDALRDHLDELATGEIAISVVSTRAPSPFAQSVTWARTNTAMYEDDTPELGSTDGPRSLRGDLVRHVAECGQLRPEIAPEIVARFEERAQRRAVGYGPPDSGELVEWAIERVLLVESEWGALLRATVRDAGTSEETLLHEAGGRVAAVRLPGATCDVVVAVQSIPRLAHAVQQPVAGLDPRPLDGSSLSLDRLPPPPDAPVEDVLTAVVGEWLRGWGPVAPSWVAEVVGAVAPTALEHLADSSQVVIDRITTGCESLEVCDRVNLEALLRLQRAARRPQLELRPLHELALLMAMHQGVGGRGTSPAALGERLEQLLGYPAQAAWWEELILPARLDPYYPAWLDSLLQSEPIIWLGCGDQRLTFVMDDELELLPTRGEDVQESDQGLLDLDLPDRGRLTFDEIASGHADTARVADFLWQLAWQGAVTCDSYHAVRQGVATSFTPQRPAPSQQARGGRRRLAGWRSSRPFAGSWYRLEPAREPDPLHADELARERVRVLLDRYPVLFRELLARELPPLQMRNVFRALRLMELAGEVVTGRFFDGILGPQFASHETVRRLSGSPRRRPGALAQRGRSGVAVWPAAGWARGPAGTAADVAAGLSRLAVGDGQRALRPSARDPRVA